MCINHIKQMYDLYLQFTVYCLFIYYFMKTDHMVLILNFHKMLCSRYIITDFQNLFSSSLNVYYQKSFTILCHINIKNTNISLIWFIYLVWGLIKYILFNYIITCEKIYL